MTFIFKDVKQAIIRKPTDNKTINDQNYLISYQLAHFNTSRLTRFEAPKFDPNTIQYVNLNAPDVQEAKTQNKLEELTIQESFTTEGNSSVGNE